MNYTIIGVSGQLATYLMRYMADDAGLANCQVVARRQMGTSSSQSVPTQTADVSDQAALTQHLEGTDVLIYMADITATVNRNIVEFETMLEAAKAAFVTQLIFVGSFADQERNPYVLSPFYGYATRRLATAGIPYAVIKNALLADQLIPSLPEFVRQAALTYPVGDQALSYIGANNSAEVIAKVAVTPTLRGKGQSYTLTQPCSLKMTDLAHILTMTLGEKIGYAPASLQDFAASQRKSGIPGRTSLYQAGAMGLLDIVTDDFETIVGRRADGMAAILKQRVALI
ncbi:hypothetical protein AYR62_14655 [Secundilactobacillus paracollinoides]|uniref:NAD(P)-binding domain-containing protein n=1 Tax=Secundilactobacillus paracollinoides TaxID=240427 RepID=A0A1B2IXB6_9LACO|nr:NAD(P)H-binding protein [Secundilactobacillus paracollinoides]ANZ65197.1 hypothetical protein AYR62_14655 [Secundilactobacillus paracollinoides]ANZ66669.1 hypothetical protein AYR63_05645 [Secundilactobacillus paracollinoides]